MSDALGDRIKGYEAAETGRKFMPMLPIVARLDGRSFSGFTRGMTRPFDVNMQTAMTDTAAYLLDESDARIAYTQSDEISLVWQQREPKSQVFFDGTVFKMVSTLAALATARFLIAAQEHWPDRVGKTLPTFDCRVFQVPSMEEAANAFLWREYDATKNAITQAAQHYYSHRELDGKNGADKQEMLFAKGVNFNDYPARFKRGAWLRRELVERTLTAEEMERIPERHRPTDPVLRHVIREIDMPLFGKVTNRVAVMFDGAQPQVAVA